MRDEINFRDMILGATSGAEIVGCVIGLFDEGPPWRDDPHGLAHVAGRLLSWAQAAPLLDYVHDAGFGGADCHPVYAWTADRVIFIHEYDGATHAHWVPRHPADCVPLFDGTE